MSCTVFRTSTLACVDLDEHFILCADEVSAIVVDVGYTSCKAGFAGEDNPKAVFPSVWSLPPHVFCIRQIL